MAGWWNEYDVCIAHQEFGHAGKPNALSGVEALAWLVDWTNANSDGWPYWSKPARAAGRLMDLLTQARPFDAPDVDGRDLRGALTPIKSFLTRQHIDPDSRPAALR